MIFLSFENSSLWDIQLKEWTFSIQGKSQPFSFARSKEKEKEKNVEKAKQESHAHEVPMLRSFFLLTFSPMSTCFFFP